MGEVIVLMHLTLDGVMQAPGRPDEDTRDGFIYGGWAAPRGDAVAEVFGGRGQVAGLLFGRRTYEDFYSFWPQQTNNPFTDVLNTMPKYVSSTTLAEPLPWDNSTLLQGDAAEAVAALKRELDGELLIMGSGDLVRSLQRRNLVDEYRLLVHPLILGSGRRLFVDGSLTTTLQLVRATTTASGVAIMTYRPVQPQPALTP